MGDIKNYGHQRLIVGFKTNNSSVLKEVYTKTYPKVYTYVLKNNGDDAFAKDIYQDAFIACWHNIKDGKFSENGNVEAYLYTIAKNKWIDYLRSNAYKKTISTHSISNLTIVEEEETDVDKDLHTENHMILKQAFVKLGNNCKTLLKLFYFERKAMNEISEILDMTSASARNQKYRCMEKLKSLSLELKK